METASADCPAEPLDAEHPLYLLYTSGTTGKPKGILHTTGGYSVGTYITTKWIFDIRDEDTFWCTADIGWVTGHSYIVYGPLQNGATSLMYEGAPTWPEADRFWRIVEKYQVNIFYTAPTAIRAFMRLGEQWPRKYDMKSLRLLGSVGEPINPEAWMWYREVIGRGRCPIVDTWWQTETGAAMITPLPGAIATKPGSATKPFPGVIVDVVNREGQPVPKGAGGFLVIKQPWPSMLRTIYGDPERYQQQYWSQIPGVYFAGDGARIDEDGYIWLMGRVDDVLNVAGHRLSTMEIESALVANPVVAEAAVVGRPDDIKGQAVAAFVTLKAGQTASEALKQTTAPVGGAGDRPHRQARRHPLHRLAAQDAQRQDHAAPAARDRDQRDREGRHHDAGGFFGAYETVWGRGVTATAVARYCSRSLQARRRADLIEALEHFEAGQLAAQAQVVAQRREIEYFRRAGVEQFAAKRGQAVVDVLHCRSAGLVVQRDAAILIAIALLRSQRLWLRSTVIRAGMPLA